ncbi:hypothetical protein FHG87_024590, partial [Trinorchestia longiramus]
MEHGCISKPVNLLESRTIKSELPDGELDVKVKAELVAWNKEPQ